MSEKYAGLTSENIISDFTILTSDKIETDFSLSGAEICTSEENFKGSLTGFRFITAHDHGDAGAELGEHTDLELAGSNNPEENFCRTASLSNASSDPIISVTLWVDEVIVGISILKG